MKKVLPPGAERRQHARKNVIENQLVTVEFGPYQRGVLIDVSEGGVAVQPFVPIPVGTASPVQFDLPGSDGAVHASGIVAWVSESGRTGIRFVEVSGATLDLLRQWVEDGEPSDVSAATSPATTLVAQPAEILAETPSAHPALAVIVETLRSDTRADGAAVALREGDVFVCRANSGAAPDLGVAISPGTGLAGACVRTARVIYCTDTQTDSRVDHAACLRLNLRSTAVMPVLIGGEVNGIVEIFASVPYAFSDADIDRLRDAAHTVADIAASAVAGPAHMQGGAPGAPVDVAPIAPDTVADAVGATVASSTLLANSATAVATAPALVHAVPDEAVQAAAEQAVSPELSANTLPGATTKRRRNLALTVAAVVLLAALGAGGWVLYSHKRSIRPASPKPTAAVNPLPTTPAPVPPPQIRAQPSAATDAAPPKPSLQPRPPAPAKRNAANASPAKDENDPEVRTWMWSAGSKVLTSEPIPIASAHAVTQAPEPPPVINERADDRSMVASILTSAPVGLPNLQVTQSRVSQVTPGKLIRKVVPAAQHGRGGEVVLKVTIKRDGKVTNIRRVSGQAVLANAASRAVSDWKYEPYRLNGEPVEVDTLVTFNFPNAP